MPKHLSGQLIAECFLTAWKESQAVFKVENQFAVSTLPNASWNTIETFNQRLLLITIEMLLTTGHFFDCHCGLIHAVNDCFHPCSQVAMCFRLKQMYLHIGTVNRYYYYCSPYTKHMTLDSLLFCASSGGEGNHIGESADNRITSGSCLHHSEMKHTTLAHEYRVMKR